MSDLVCGYGDRKVVESPGFALREGECLALVGPNGSGKTTLLKTLAGQIDPLQGRVTISGASIHGLKPSERARRIALLPQEGTVDPELTVQELVALGRTPFLDVWGGLGCADREAVEATIERLGLGDLRDRKVGEISGGERQRARLAMVLTQQAPLLLLDEPAAHLDLKRRYELSSLLKQLRSADRLAFVVVVHDLAGLLDFSDRVMVISGGRSEIFLPDQAQALENALQRAFDVPAAWVGPLRLS